MRKIISLAALLAIAVACVKEPTSLTITPSEVEIEQYSSYKLEATVLPADAEYAGIFWTTSNSEVATVSDNGLVQAFNPGTTVIRASTGGVTGECIVTVKEAYVPVTGVWINYTEYTVIKGESFKLEASVVPELATNKGLSFYSERPEIAKVDDTGLVTGVDTGWTVVRVSSAEGNFVEKCHVTVAPINVDVDGVTVTPSTLELQEGETYTLSAFVSPADADQDVQWASQDTKIATVDASGRVTALSAGSTRIFARSTAFNDKQGFCELTVTPDTALKGISMDVSSLTLTVGQARQLNVLYTPSYAANKTVFWTSDNPSVASVSPEGKVAALSEGCAVITATSEEGGFTATCSVTVSKEAGTRVYYIVYSGLWVNGERDPLDGCFNVEETESFLRHQYTYYICSNGSDLYSVEAYYEGTKDLVWDKEYGSTYYYLCENRKPLFKLPWTTRIKNICVSGNKIGMLLESSSRAYSVARFNLDGTYTTCDLVGTGAAIFSPDIAMAPNGDLYVACCLKDSFGEEYLAQYKYAMDGTLTEQLIRKNRYAKPCIAVSEESDVYILDDNFVAGDHQVVLYRNGEEYMGLDTPLYNIQLAVASRGGHVYTVVTDGPGLTMRVRRDDELLYSIVSDEKEFNSGFTNPICVSSTGDIYVAMSYGFNGVSCIFKNDWTLYTRESESYSAMAIVE